MTKFWNKHKKTILISLSSFVLIIFLMLANLFSNLIIPSNAPSESISAPAYEIHLISLSKSQVKKEAQEHAKDFQTIGAGGYVWENGGYYHIISSAYLNKNDAALVQNNIKLNHNLDTELLTINLKGYTLYGNFESEETKVLNKILLSCMEFYTTVYDVAISLDTGVYGETSAKLNVNSAINNLSTNIANFKTLFSSPLPENLQPIERLMKDAFAIGQKLSTIEKENSEQNYPSLLKYRYTEMLRLYYDFVN